MLVKKVKVRDDMFADVDYSEKVGTTNDQFGRVCNNPMHDDFKEAVQKLGIHAILITELVDPTKVKGEIEDYHPAILKFVKIKGISWGGDAGDGITISFERKLSTGRVINMNTPFTKFNDEAIVYKFDTELQEACETIISEVEEYLEGKFGEGAQTEMEMPQGELEHV